MLVSWTNARMALTLLRMQIHTLYRAHRTRVRVLVLLWLLSRAWKPLLRGWLRQMHYKATAEVPRLHYQRTPANEKLLASCEALTTHKYYPPWYLFNGHLQTIQLSFEDETSQPVVRYERQTIDLPDGGIVSLDWALPSRPDGSIPRVSELDPSRRTMLLLPGLTGASGEYYIRCVVDHMVKTRGWQAVVLNARSCGDTPVKTAQLFCMAYTDDLRFVLQQLNAKYRFRDEALVAVGFSMGSNLLVKYLGEEKENALVSGGISVANPFDLVRSYRSLTSTLFKRRVYDATLTNNLVNLFFNKSNAHEVFGKDPRYDLQALRQSSSLAEYDERLTCITFAFDSVNHYYSVGSSSRVIQDVRVPLLCVNAADDPICHAANIPLTKADENPNLIFCVTKAGGHLGFYEDTSAATTNTASSFTSSMWSVKAIAEFAESVRHNQQKI